MHLLDLDDALLLDIIVRATRDGCEGVGDDADAPDGRAETLGVSYEALDLALVCARFRPLAAAAAVRTIEVGSATQLLDLLEHVDERPGAAVHIRGIALSHQFARPPRPRMAQVAGLLRLATCAVSLRLDLPGVELGELVDALPTSFARIRYLSLVVSSWTSAPPSLSLDALRLLGMVGRSLRWLVLDCDGADVDEAVELQLPALRGFSCCVISPLALRIVNATEQLRAVAFRSRSDLKTESRQFVDGVRAEVAASIEILRVRDHRAASHHVSSFAAFGSLQLLDVGGLDAAFVRELPPTLRELVVRSDALPLTLARGLIEESTWLPNLRSVGLRAKRRHAADRMLQRDIDGLIAAARARGVRARILTEVRLCDLTTAADSCSSRTTLFTELDM